MVKWNEDVYNIPAYPITDAARYLHIPVGTLRSWLQGRSYPTKDGQRYSSSLIQRPHPELSQLSFTNLIEAHVLRSIRKVHGVRLDKVRNALDYLDDQFKLPHPLVRVEFQTDGVSLFVESVGRLVNVSQDGQLAMKAVLQKLLTRVEWNEQGIATRLFPINRAIPAEFRHEAFVEQPKSVLLDPRISFGRPVIVGNRIPTRAIAERYEAGESPEAIADDLGCSPSQVHDAIRFELVLPGAA
ncbi:MAG: DUF433 domain-containing protein [Cyanobacteria bacterium P01_F01_bin.150]